MLVRVEAAGGLQLAKLAVGQRHTQEELGMEQPRGGGKKRGRRSVHTNS